MTTSEYTVKGMHCVGCSTAIKKLLEKNKHIQEVRVELYESKLYVTYDESNVDHETIVTTVGRFGYQAAKA
jgi:copper chaperone/Cu+-exporting ATPase